MSYTLGVSSLSVFVCWVLGLIWCRYFHLIFLSYFRSSRVFPQYVRYFLTLSLHKTWSESYVYRGSLRTSVVQCLRISIYIEHNRVCASYHVSWGWEQIRSEFCVPFRLPDIGQCSETRYSCLCCLSWTTIWNLCSPLLLIGGLRCLCYPAETNFRLLPLT